MRRILQVILNGEGTVGGEQEHVISLIAGLDPERFEVDVITWDIPAFADRLRELGVHTTSVTARRILDLRLLARLEAAIRAGGYDIVHAHGHRAGLLGRYAAIRAGAPHLVWTCHLAENKADRTRLLAWGYKRALSWLDARTDVTVAVSQQLRLWLAEHGTTMSRCVVIPNGVDSDRFAPGLRDVALIESLGLDPAAPIIGAVARLTEQKGVDTLIAAAEKVAASMPDAQVVLVGSGPLESRLKAQAAETGARTVFAGERRDIVDLLRAFDVAVIPSRWEGAFCFTVLEAMATGRPVVASDIPLFADVIEPGVDALMFPAGDADALASAIVFLLRNPEDAARIAEAGRNLVTERFSADAMREQMVELYNDLLGEERP